MTTGKEAAPATPKTAEQRLDAIEGVVFEVLDKLEALAKDFAGLQKSAVTKPKGLFGGKRTPTPMKDLKTGIVYASKAAVGKALAAEAGADPLDSMAYYTVIKVLRMPDKDASDRFAPASEEEGAKAREEAKAKLQAEVDAANAKIAVEEAAKAKQPTAAPKAPVAQPKKK